MRRLLAATAARIGLRTGARRFHPDRAVAARAFDRAFYLKSYPDVAEAGVDPLDHFLTYGWQEGRDPSREFSVRAYLDAFPEVAASGANPLVHYLTSGRSKVIAPESPQGFRYEIIDRLEPMEERLAQAAAGARSCKTAGAAGLAAALALSRAGLRDLHITFSHDDYTANVGGLQAAIQREAARLAELGRDHLHLHPASAWPMVRADGDPGALGVVWNGRSLGAFEPGVVARAVAGAATGPAETRSFAIHSLLGHTADEVLEILAAAGLDEGVFWLHDFASLCAGFHLLRNDVEDCAAPPADSAACGVCLYGPWRARHEAAHARLFDRLKLTVAAPSQPALDLWRRASRLRAAGAVVLPHVRLTPTGPAPVPSAARPFRLAYAGLPTPHKGWPVFRALVAKFVEDPRYEFLHLGARRDPRLPVRFEPVAAGRDSPLAMRDALAAEEVDAILAWPLCRETFSFVAHEAVAAGCAVITGPDSGNLAAFVAETGHGRVLPDEAALAAAFDTGAILDLARARRRPMLHDLAFSALTLDLARAPTT